MDQLMFRVSIYEQFMSYSFLCNYCARICKKCKVFQISSLRFFQGHFSIATLSFQLGLQARLGTFPTATIAAVPWFFNCAIQSTNRRALTSLAEPMAGVIWVFSPKLLPLFQPGLRGQQGEAATRVDFRVRINFGEQAFIHCA